MCGRYTQTKKTHELVARFDIEEPDFDLAPRFNLAPSQDAPVVGVNPQTPEIRSLRLIRWGLIPYHAKDATKPIINARAETLGQRPAFRGLVPRRRCVVLADGFYEWRKEGRFKTPMRFMLKSGQPFAFAGLWDRWLQPNGDLLYSFTIVTTRPNSLLEPVHNRMPAILLPGDEDKWLDPVVTTPTSVLPLLNPYPADLMEGYGVSRAVNSPVNDSPDCIAVDDARLTLLRRP